VPSAPIIPSLASFPELLHAGTPSPLEQRYESYINRQLGENLPSWLKWTRPLTPRTLGEAGTMAGTVGGYGLQALGAIPEPLSPLLETAGKAMPYLGAAAGGVLESAPGERWQGAERELIKTAAGRLILGALGSRVQMPGFPDLQLPLQPLRQFAAGALKPTAGAIGGQFERQPASGVALGDLQEMATHLLNFIWPGE
jgi:hypothetical protein